MSESACPSSSSRVSSSPKSGAWKGFVAGGGDPALALRVAPSGAENNEVSSMRGLPFVTGRWDLVCRDRARRSYSLLILAYGLRMRS